MIRQILLHLKPQRGSMKKLFLPLGTALLMVSCGTSKPVTVKRSVPTKTVAKSPNLRTLDSRYSGSASATVREILKDAEKYLGAPYRPGGNTPAGFDCSGFTVKVFAESDLKLPRRSADQALVGDKIEIRSVRPGDLLFFATSGPGRVSHVGIVHHIGNDGEVKFIHASTSKGVIISSLNETYWNKNYLHATRVL